MRRRDVGQPCREAEPAGARLQVQGRVVRRRDLAAARFGGAAARRDTVRAAPVARTRGNAGRSRMPGLRRQDVGRPCEQAKPASTGLQVSQQAEGHGWPRLPWRHLATARRRTPPVDDHARRASDATGPASTRRRRPAAARPRLSTVRRRRSAVLARPVARLRRPLGSYSKSSDNRNEKPGSTASPSMSPSGEAVITLPSARYTVATRRSGSITHTSLTPASSHSPTLASTSPGRSSGERISATRSGASAA
jgi:hypothetical protein